jgi:type III secretion system YscI/HrpB-like protein
MTETIAVEAVRRTAAANGAAWQMPGQVGGTPDPSSVSRFQAAMGVGGPKDVDPIPFASEATAAWRAAQENNQGILHRIRALSELGQMNGNGPAAQNMIELQYEVMNLSFQQEVVTKVADKASNAIQTLIKNQ